MDFVVLVGGRQALGGPAAGLLLFFATYLSWKVFRESCAGLGVTRTRDFSRQNLGFPEVGPEVGQEDRVLAEDGTDVPVSIGEGIPGPPSVTGLGGLELVS